MEELIGGRSEIDASWLIALARRCGDCGLPGGLREKEDEGEGGSGRKEGTWPSEPRDPLPRPSIDRTRSSSGSLRGGERGGVLCAGGELGGAGAGGRGCGCGCEGGCGSALMGRAADGTAGTVSLSTLAAALAGVVRGVVLVVLPRTALRAGGGVTATSSSPSAGFRRSRSVILVAC
jgi:hypothetical protein